MWHGYYVGGSWWMMGLGMLFWGGVIALGVWAVARYAGGARTSDTEARQEDPIVFLKERLARGEISETEYQRIKHQLEER